MTGNKVNIEVSTTDKNTENVLNRIERSVDKTEAKLAKLEKTGKRSGKSVKAGFDSSLATIGKFSGALTGVGSAIGGIAATAALINEQHEALIRREKERSVVSQNFGQVMRGVRIAFNEDATLSDKDLESNIQKLAKDTRTNPNIFGTALIDTFSAKGSRTNQDALNAQVAAFQLTPGKLEDGRTIAARALDLANNFGVEDMKANVGFMQNIQNSARLTSLEKVGSNLLPGVISTTAFGDTPEQAAEIGVTLTKLMTDAEGRNTRTAMIAMAQQLADFVPDQKARERNEKERLKIAQGKKGKLVDLEIPEEQTAEFESAKTTTERISVMQKFPKLQQQFLSGASFEKTAVKAVERLLTGTEVALQQLKTTREQIRPLDLDQVKTFNEKLKSIEHGQFETGLRAVEESRANTTNVQLKDRASSLKGSARKIFEETIQNVSEFPGTQTKLHFFRDLLGKSQRKSSIETLIDTLEAEKTFEDEVTIRYIDSQKEQLRKLQDKLEEVEPPEPPKNILKETAKGIRGLITDRPQRKITFKQLNNLASQFGFSSRTQSSNSTLGISKAQNNESNQQSAPASQPISERPFYERELIQALNGAASVFKAVDKQLRENNQLRKQEQQRNGGSIPNIAPPPRRPAYKSPAENLSVSRDR